MNDRKQPPFLELPGEFYQSFLAKLHTILNPSTYLEVGTRNGDTLKLARCASIAIDPNFAISDDVLRGKPSCHFFREEGSEFLARTEPESLFGRSVDFAFLDDHPLFERVLRDLIGIEKHCTPDGVIVIHNCVPGDTLITARTPQDPIRLNSVHPNYWTGDAWKVIPVLLEYRSDLRVTIVDTHPTGLVILSNLKADNDALLRNYDTIIEDYMGLSLEEYGIENLYAMCDLKPSAGITGRIHIFGEGPFAVDHGSSALFSVLTYHSPIPPNCSDSDLVTIFDAGETERTLVRPAPIFHVDPDGAKLFPSVDEIRINQHPTYSVEGKGIHLIGYRSYITKSGNFFTDEAHSNPTERDQFYAKLAMPEPFYNEDTGFIPTDDEGRFRLDLNGRTIEDLDGDIISLCSLEPTNYGAFLFRTLPKLVGRDITTRNYRVLAPLFNTSMRDLFAMAGLESIRIIPHDPHKIYRLERAIVPSVRNPHALLDRETTEFYARIRDRYRRPNRSRKLFVSRMGWTGSVAAQSRIMINERDLADRLIGEGFEILLTHELSIEEQITAFASADMIVGASGSAMFNAVFCTPGTTLIDIESEPHWIFAHANLFGSCGLRYGIVEAQAINQDWSVPHKPFRVNVDAVIDQVRAS